MPLDTNPIDIRVILGSTTPPGRMHRAVDGAIERAAALGTSADLIDLGTLDLGFANGTPPADLDDDTKFHLVENWENEELMNAHVDSPHAHNFVAEMPKLARIVGAKAYIGELAPYRVRAPSPPQS